MSCENKLTNTVFKNKENRAKTQCASFSLFPLFIFILYIYIYISNKKHLECNAMQLLETKRKNKKTKKQRTKVTKGKAMKYKDHVKKTQLD